MYIHKDDAFLIQWDHNKSQLNTEKHGVEFNEAASVLFANVLELADQKHSLNEERYLIIGKALSGRILLVVYSPRSTKDGKKIYHRIISARIANQKERRLYESQG